MGLGVGVGLGLGLGLGLGPPRRATTDVERRRPEHLAKAHLAGVRVMG